MTLLLRRLLTSKDKSTENVTCHQRQYRRVLRTVDKLRKEIDRSEAQWNFLFLLQNFYRNSAGGGKKVFGLNK